MADETNPRRLNDGVLLDTPLTGLIPWPVDAVMIVAADAGTENPATMESAVPVVCRHCGQALAADSATIRKAEKLPSRRGRPVMFFCVACCLRHDRGSVRERHDDRHGAK